MSVGGFLAGGSALRAGVLSFASPKESSQRKGDPEGGAGFAGSLRYSAGRAVCQNSPAAQTWQTEIPRPTCVAQRLPRGPKGVTRLNFEREADCYGQPGKRLKNLLPKLVTDVFLGPLRGAEQRRLAGRFLLALFEPQASLASSPACRVAQGTGVAGTDPGVAFSLATFFWPPKRKYARPQGGTLSQSKQSASQIPMLAPKGATP